MHYSIQTVSEKTGLSVHALRYYEKEGVLTGIHRTQGGVRYYTDEDLELLGLITCLKNTGMPLKEIRTFMQLKAEGPATLKQRCAILKVQRQKVLDGIDAMQRNLEKVNHKLRCFSEELADYEAGRA
jgi:DNA-binding transcriptional MerR regulator